MHETSAPRPRTLLFIGDSITDCDRRNDPDGLGYGYVRLIAEHMAAHEPATRVVNRGISGNRAVDLVDRFTPDCLDLDPDEVTIFVGVNDTWRRYDSDDPTSAEDFERDYRFMLDQLSATRPAVPVIMVVPFLTDIDENVARMHEDLDGKARVIRDLAHEFGHRVVDAEHLMREALREGHTPDSLAADGVHPSIAGHRLLADAWLETDADIQAHHHR